MERERGEGNYSAKQRRKRNSGANLRIRAKSCVLMQLCGIGYFGAFFFFFLRLGGPADLSWFGPAV